MKHNESKKIYIMHIFYRYKNRSMTKLLIIKETNLFLLMFFVVVLFISGSHKSCNVTSTSSSLTSLLSCHFLLCHLLLLTCKKPPTWLLIQTKVNYKKNLCTEYGLPSLSIWQPFLCLETLKSFFVMKAMRFTICFYTV